MLISHTSLTDPTQPVVEKRVLVETITVQNGDSSIVVSLPDGYRKIVLGFEGVTPLTNNVNMSMRISTTTVGSWLTTSGYNEHVFDFQNTTINPSHNVSNSLWTFARGVGGSTRDRGFNGDIIFFDPKNADNDSTNWAPIIMADGRSVFQQRVPTIALGSAKVNVTVPIEHAQIYLSSGNFREGVVRVFGVKWETE